MPTIKDKLNIPDIYTKSKYGEDYVIYKPQVPGDLDLFIFSSNHNLQDLWNSETWLCDGTFKISPKGYLQLYTIHGFVNKECLPLVHCLMKDKKRITYEFILTKLLERIRTTLDNGYKGPRRLLTDFEEAVRNAFKNVMPDTAASGCSFHFAQALYRKINECGLSTVYKEDKYHIGLNSCYGGHVYKWFRRVFGLVMLKPSGLDFAWRLLVAELEGPMRRLIGDTQTWNKVVRFANYFQKTWLNGRGTREWWNMWAYDSLRTTNHCESWHSAIRHEFNVYHPRLE